MATKEAVKPPVAGSVVAYARTLGITGADLGRAMKVTKQRVWAMDADGGRRSYGRLTSAVEQVARERYGLPPDALDHPSTPFVIDLLRLLGGKIVTEERTRR